MKIKIKVVLLIVLFIIFGLFYKVDAAMQIKAGGNVHMNITASEAYQYCLDLKDTPSTLGNNNLQPHMAKSSEFGAGWYLGVSSYGNGTTNMSRPVWGSGYNTYSTTPNITGLMDFNNYIYTATLANNYTEAESITNLTKNARSKYVEILKPASEYNDWDYGLVTCNGKLSNYPTDSSQAKLVCVGYYTYVNRIESSFGIGTKASYTYRPVIWN